MEKLINSIPREVNVKTDPKTSQTHGNGFSLRWSVNRQKWLCGYSVNFRPGKEDEEHQPYVMADDPIEAVAIFAEKLSQRIS